MKQSFFTLSCFYNNNHRRADMQKTTELFWGRGMPADTVYLHTLCYIRADDK